MRSAHKAVFPVNSLIFGPPAYKICVKPFVYTDIKSKPTYSLLIPCFLAWSSRKAAIHAGFHACSKKIPCYFPCLSGNSQKNESASQPLCYRFGPAGYIKLADDRTDVKFCSVFGDAEARSDLFISEAACQQPEHLDFARCEIFERLAVVANILREILCNLAGDLGVERHQSGCGGQDSSFYLVRRGFRCEHACHSKIQECADRNKISGVD